MTLSPDAQMKILNLYRGQSIKKAEHALVVADSFARTKQCSLRIKLVGITIGD